MQVEKIVISLGEGKAPLELTLEEALTLRDALDKLLGRSFAARDWVPCPVYIPQQPWYPRYQITCGTASTK